MLPRHLPVDIVLKYSLENVISNTMSEHIPENDHSTVICVALHLRSQAIYWHINEKFIARPSEKAETIYLHKSSAGLLFL